MTTNITISYKTLIEEVCNVAKIDYLNYDEEIHNDWNGTLSISGIKRLIYGLWNNGMNEYNEDMLLHMSSPAREEYMHLVRKYQDTQMPIIHIHHIPRVFDQYDDEYYHKAMEEDQLYTDLRNLESDQELE